MHKIIAGSMLMIGLLLGTSTLSFAAQSIHATPARSAASHIEKAKPVYYYYHHHRYRHRSWDKKHHRWHYY